MSSKECKDKLSPVLFWDMDRNAVNLDQCPGQIIQRVLEYGEMDDWRLIRDYYGMDKIAEACKQLRTLDPKALAYICLMSNTKPTEYRCYHFRQSNPTL